MFSIKTHIELELSWIDLSWEEKIYQIRSNSTYAHFCLSGRGKNEKKNKKELNLYGKIFA
jgi:hypothetical protein